MSSTNQFPPRHFIPDEGDAKSDHDAAPTPNQASQETSAPLGLPAPPTGDQTPAKGHSKEHSIDVGQPGQRIALDHLGPMVVSKVCHALCQNLCMTMKENQNARTDWVTFWAYVSCERDLSTGQQRRHSVTHSQLGQHDGLREGKDITPIGEEKSSQSG
ncbi:unnamed protein product [Sympodiomycopsis kandeliae]